MEKKEPDYKAFVPIGFSFLAIGIVFLKKSPGIGLAFIGIGISWISIGYSKSKNKKGGNDT
ncbi:MAG: hypothetical protein JXN63_08400 [Candidatus Delongbacteria bacterium]|nr:hypothetical protein [Candidatus Delongbacteria bacterium]